MGNRRKFENSDVPYKDRLLMRKYQNVKDQRNDAARIAIKVACVAMNDTMEMGFQRLCRFADHFSKLIRLYYDQPDVQEVHLNDRLREIGFTVREDGVVLAWQDESGKFCTLEQIEKGEQQE